MVIPVTLLCTSLALWWASHSPSHCPQCHALADGSVVVRVSSAPALHPSSACTRLCWRGTTTWHPPCAWGMPHAQGDPLLGVCYDPYGKPQSHMTSSEHARVVFLWDRADRMGKKVLNSNQLPLVMENVWLSIRSMVQFLFFLNILCFLMPLVLWPMREDWEYKSKINLRRD